MLEMRTNERGQVNECTVKGMNGVLVSHRLACWNQGRGSDGPGTPASENLSCPGGVLVFVVTTLGLDRPDRSRATGVVPIACTKIHYCAELGQWLDSGLTAMAHHKCRLNASCAVNGTAFRVLYLPKMATLVTSCHSSPLTSAD